MIPKQLQNEEFRFCLIRKQSKAPFEKEWQKRGYKWNDQKLVNHLNNNGNYGVIGGYGNLRILDIDDKSRVEEFKKIFSNTFMVRTGSGGLHIYLISEYDKNHVLKDGLGEFRANNYQVVGPGSLHPNGNRYVVINDCEIAKISKQELEKILKPFLREEAPSFETFDKEKPKDESRSGLEYRKVIALIMQGKTKEQIFKEMMAYSKWASAHPQYRELTYKKALAFVNREISEEDFSEILKEAYTKIIEVLKEYVDMREEYYPIVALWIIGTYFHKSFPSYPFLFFNAMKGSGKTRLLKLCSHLAKNGKVIASISEAVLFRTAHKSTFFIDEFEKIGGKEKQTLRELLNAAYKRGVSVERSKKYNFKGFEGYRVEKYDLYCPIAMANIWGMEEVLGDRCITLVLEKSENPYITRLLEIFGEDEKIREIKRILSSIGNVGSLKQKSGNEPLTPSKAQNSGISTGNEGSVCSVAFLFFNIYKSWNSYIKDLSKLNVSTKGESISTLTTLSINGIKRYKHYSLLEKIYKSELNARHLELFFPLFILGYFCGVLDDIIEIAKSIVKEKKELDVDESRDVSLIDFVSQQDATSNFVRLKDLVADFKQFFSDDEDEAKWINSKWVGRALKRLNLIKDRRKVRGCREVILDVAKARSKIRMFKEEPLDYPESKAPKVGEPETESKSQSEKSNSKLEPSKQPFEVEYIKMVPPDNPSTHNLEKIDKK